MAEAPDRRPIAMRGRPWAQAVAAWLVRRRASPNAISVAGMLCGLIGGLAFAATEYAPSQATILWLLAAACVQLRLAANMFDGMVAVGRGIASPLGELYNEVPDRVSDSALLLGFGVAADGNWGLGLAAALAAMATAYVRAIGKAAGAGSDFSGPMAKQQRMFLVTVGALWFGLAPSAWQPRPGGIGLAAWVLAVIIAGATWTALRRLRRIARALVAEASP